MITFNKFAKSYGGNEIIVLCDFAFADKEISFLMAPNGAGKTTLIKCMCGLEQYDGSISVDGMDISILRDKIFVVWDDTPFFENLSGYKNIRIFNDNADVDKAQLAEICKKYLPEDTLKRKVKTYSYGQKKKLALILVELLKPEILIMDEISNGLDRDLMNELQNHLQRLMENTTIVLTGHQFEFYEDIVTSVFVVKDKLVSDKTVQFKSNGGKLDDIYKEAFQ